MEPGEIEIDRSGSWTVVRIHQPTEEYTVDQLRMYAEYLATVAREAEAPPQEPDVEALVAVFNGTPARYMRYEEGLLELARAVVAAGYKREPGSAATGEEPAA